ncbi:uncharacterized protein BCR38DRAFT_487682 [Pseudomassariella vexata]|uniref:Uncharacterized protein n=1 Tax=Pseudomassariella vexata TaxID=1141098 RepID=A0A1Y2DNA8_9PEZI|nr:uncharacterized protein BCR38DRAFT_487682 [Pseudomassariella vexata]ORY60626.1 hypothetical protein BCR38DRAFT_487682 [Pseudomassariella vexata]
MCQPTCLTPPCPQFSHGRYIHSDSCEYTTCAYLLPGADLQFCPALHLLPRRHLHAARNLQIKISVLSSSGEDAQSSSGPIVVSKFSCKGRDPVMVWRRLASLVEEVDQGAEESGNDSEGIREVKLDLGVANARYADVVAVLRVHVKGDATEGQSAEELAALAERFERLNGYFLSGKR